MASANATYGQKESSDQNFDYMFKILIIGNSSVGKTSFLFRYADDSFTPAFVSTVGIDFKVKTIYRNDKRIKLQIWVRKLTHALHIYRRAEVFRYRSVWWFPGQVQQGDQQCRKYLGKTMFYFTLICERNQNSPWDNPICSTFQFLLLLFLLCFCSCSFYPYWNLFCTWTMHWNSDADFTNIPDTIWVWT